jgi:hypothetical protein
MLFAMKYAGGLLDGIEHGIYMDLADGAAEALLDEAAKFAENGLTPINRNGISMVPNSSMESSRPRRAGPRPTRNGLKAAGIPLPPPLIMVAWGCRTS